MNRDELDRKFYAGERSERFPLAVNDSVEIIEGVGSGKQAAVISIELGPGEISYLVEPGDGSGDLVVPVRCLKRIQQGAKRQHNKAFKVVPALRASTGRKNAAHSYAA